MRTKLFAFTPLIIGAFLTLIAVKSSKKVKENPYLDKKYKEKLNAMLPQNK